MIEVTNLEKHFGDIRAVDGVNFTANDGEITGLLGPNGAGKTTTLRMLYSLLPPDAGEIQVDGLNPVEQPVAVRKRLGVMPDARGVYERLTAKENIRFFGELQGMSRAELDHSLARLVEQLGMEDILERRCKGFSQGQRVKVALARALVHDPANVLLDEPTNGLDVMSTRAMREFIRSLKASGRCVILSTHIMQEVAALCDRIVIIAKGRIVAEGSKDQLMERAGTESLEDAFVSIIGTEEGLVT